MAQVNTVALNTKCRTQVYWIHGSTALPLPVRNERFREANLAVVKSLSMCFSLPSPEKLLLRLLQDDRHMVLVLLMVELSRLFQSKGTVLLSGSLNDEPAIVSSLIRLLRNFASKVQTGEFF